MVNRESCGYMTWAYEMLIPYGDEWPIRFFFGVNWYLLRLIVEINHSSFVKLKWTANLC